MSKKKAFSGSTMTLKDFHGGSIPSDLPLPSAPGATVTRPSSDRGGYDRQAPWGNPMNRSDHRLRPGSSGSNRNFDDKASFLSHPIHIGRNFDEDERKPLDGISHPRRTISDEVIQAQPTRHEITKLDSVTSPNYSGRQVLNNPMPQSTSGGIHSYRYGESIPVGGSNQMLGGNNSNQGVPNAWGVRKEVGGVNEQVHSSSWSEQSAISKFAQASALDKVSRWQNKPVPQFHHHHNQQSDVEVIHYAEPERYSGLNTMIERRDNEAGFDNSVKELPNSERARSPIYPEAKESSSPLYQDMLRPVSTDGKYSGVPKLQPPVSEEVSERRKLKLLPRSKPLEVLEPSIAEHKMVNDPGHGAAVTELHGNTNVPKLGLAGNEGGGPSVERPKLHLKHRSQIAEQVEETAAKERKSVFGGARPRELVLRERGVDDVVISNLESIQSPNRVKLEVHKIETKAEPARYGERSENVHVDHRAAKDPERKDNRGDNHKTDTQKSSWRKESWRNGNKATEKQQQQEPRPEPETWRKPIEQSNPAPSDGLRLRYGKAASALELAQAFSRSVSTNPKTPDRISSQKGMAGQPQIPFSRLTATTTTTATREIYSGRTPRRQINGY